MLACMTSTTISFFFMLKMILSEFFIKGGDQVYPVWMKTTLFSEVDIWRGDQFVVPKDQNIRLSNPIFEEQHLMSIVIRWSQ